MRRAAVILACLLPLPAFALSSALESMLSAMMPSLIQLGVVVLTAHVAIYGMKLLRQAIDDRAVAQVDNSGDVLAEVGTSGADWSSMSTHIDYFAEAPDGGDTLPDIDPALLSGFDDIDFLVVEDQL